VDTLRALNAACVVLQAQSFSGAARQLGTSPAAVSKLVAQLEARIGIRLFERTTRHLVATAQGRDLIGRVEQPLRDIDQAVEAGSGASGASGAVKVSVPAAFARMAVIPELAGFQQRHPAIRLDLRLENRRVDLVAEGYDCAIGASLAPDSSLVARTLATLRPVLCASPGYLAAHGVPRLVTDLAQHRCIGLRSDTSGQLRRWELAVRGRPVSVQPDGAVQLTDPECVAAAALAGCGIALVGLHHVAGALLDGRLLRLLPQAQATPFHIVVYHAQRRLLPARTRTFVDHVLATVPASFALKACHLALGVPPARPAR
jgi:DNA-binding transcriptional LysR family regulator